jgi:hypothetical protein
VSIETLYWVLTLAVNSLLSLIILYVSI